MSFEAIVDDARSTTESSNHNVGIKNDAVCTNGDHYTIMDSSDGKYDVICTRKFNIYSYDAYHIIYTS